MTRAAFPGLAVAATVAVAAMFLSEHYHASAMLFALLLGMSLNFLSQEGKCVEGIQLSATTVLRVGIALLGLRISVAQVADLGFATAGLIALSVLATIAIGVLLARLCALNARFGVLTGGAVAICGASAALAIAAVLPRHADSDRDTSFAVIGVTALSTIAMIAYPVVVGALGLDQRDSGVFLGGTIHDVAQVVGAGYGMSKETGDTATIVKLLRVAMLLPVVFLVSLIVRRSAIDRRGTPLLPMFGVAFFALVIVNSLGWVPHALGEVAGELSRWCLVAAIAAIGMKTSLKELSVVGLRPVVLMVLQTVALAGLVAVLILVK
ncbi:MAG TPA: putative sulfate exporter family transporter [Burkholderiales bacterium]|nr:putative sulfate exporter family transporter [Burkholderiales bacterium]